MFRLTGDNREIVQRVFVIPFLSHLPNDPQAELARCLLVSEPRRAMAMAYPSDHLLTIIVEKNGQH